MIWTLLLRMVDMFWEMGSMVVQVECRSYFLVGESSLTTQLSKRPSEG